MQSHPPPIKNAAITGAKVIQLLLTKGEGSLSIDSNSYRFVCGHYPVGSFLGISELGIFAGKVGLSHPMGDGTTSSNTDGDLILDRCC